MLISYAIAAVCMVIAGWYMVRGDVIYVRRLDGRWVVVNKPRLTIEIRQNGRWYQVSPSGPIRRFWNRIRGYQEGAKP